LIYTHKYDTIIGNNRRREEKDEYLQCYSHKGARESASRRVEAGRKTG
jgi:hypothetical protein